mgnify:CR=1 FL=1
MAFLECNFTGSPKLDKGLIRLDYVHNDEDIEADTRDFYQVLSLISKWEQALGDSERTSPQVKDMPNRAMSGA